MKTKTEKYEWVDLAELTNPTLSSTYMVYINYWWATNDKDEVCFYQGLKGARRFDYPQCNYSKQIAEKMGSMIPGYTGVIQIPLAFTPHHCDAEV